MMIVHQPSSWHCHGFGVSASPHRTGYLFSRGIVQNLMTRASIPWEGGHVHRAFSPVSKGLRRSESPDQTSQFPRSPRLEQPAPTGVLRGTQSSQPQRPKALSGQCPQSSCLPLPSPILPRRNCHVTLHTVQAGDTFGICSHSGTVTMANPVDNCHRTVTGFSS